MYRFLGLLGKSFKVSRCTWGDSGGSHEKILGIVAWMKHLYILSVLQDQKLKNSPRSVRVFFIVVYVSCWLVILRIVVFAIVVTVLIIILIVTFIQNIIVKSSI